MKAEHYFPMSTIDKQRLKEVAIETLKRLQQLPVVPEGVCPHCEGDGWIGGQFHAGGEECDVCHGTGKA